jgi:hypothetical protein
VTKYYHHAGMTPMMTTPDHMYNVFDRTRAMINIPQIEVITPIGKLCQPKTIEELCYNSAQNILYKAGSKKIYVTWSGGIDSTLVLSELLKVAPKEQLVVFMDKNSIDEYPEFYNKYIKRQLHTREMSFYTDDPLRDALKDGIVVTGHLMDPVFGANIYQALPEEKLKQSIPNFLKGVDGPSYTKYMNLINACPRDIVDVKDLFWWMDYTLNYQSEQLMWLLEIEEMVLDENLIHFGAGEDWNNYAVSTPAEIKWPGYDFNLYKIAIKEHIYKFTKDESYTKEKIKMPSWRHYRTDEQRWRDKAVWITTDWKRGYLPT